MTNKQDSSKVRGKTAVTDDDEKQARGGESSNLRLKRPSNSYDDHQSSPEKKRAGFHDRPVVINKDRAPRSTEEEDQRRVKASAARQRSATIDPSESTERRPLVDVVTEDGDDDDEAASQATAVYAHGEEADYFTTIAQQPKVRRDSIEQELLDEELKLADEQLPDISAVDLTGEYVRMHTLNVGNQSGPSPFSGGVFVVKRRADGLVCVEKRLRPHDLIQRSHLREIRLLQRLSQPGHPNIVGYIDAFATEVIDDDDDYDNSNNNHDDDDDNDDERDADKENEADKEKDPDLDRERRRRRRRQQQLQHGELRQWRQRVPKPIASLYMQYCTLGSLNMFIVRQFALCPRHPAATPFPEAFVWHVLRSLVAALVYLVTGSTSFTSVREVKGWRPIIHRDIRADNIFLRPPPIAPPPPPQAALSGTIATPGDKSSSRSKKSGGGAHSDEDGDNGGEIHNRRRQREKGVSRRTRKDEVAAAAAAIAAATATYPTVVLGDFGLARIQPPEANLPDDDSDTDPFEREAPEWVKKLLRQHRWAPTDDDLDDEWSGKRDVWGVGCVVQHTARLVQRFVDNADDDDGLLHDAPVAAEDGLPLGDSYSAELNRAAGQALERRVLKRPYAEVMLVAVNELFAQVLPEVEPIGTACRTCAAGRSKAKAEEEAWETENEAEASQGKRRSSSALPLPSAPRRPKQPVKDAALKSGVHKKAKRLATKP
jgi:serine/threonine protein kinase